MPLPQEMLEWYYHLQKELKDTFLLDTTRKEDMGRLRNLRIFVVKNEDDEEENYELEPLPFGKTDEERYMVTEDQYATIPLSEDGTNYRKPFSSDPEEAAREMISRQNTFHVEKKEDGTFVMHSSMTESELHRIYRDAVEGRLYVNTPQSTVLTTPTDSRMISVAKDGKTPVYINPYFIDVRTLSDEKFRKFYGAHPELKEVSCDNKDVTELADLEVNGYSLVEDPKTTRTQVMRAMECKSGEMMRRNDAKERMTFEKNFWEEAHEGMKPMDYAESNCISQAIPHHLEQAGINDISIEGEIGLDHFLKEDKDGRMVPLFPDLDTIGGSPAARRVAIQKRITDAVYNGELYVFGPQNDGTTAFRRLRYDWDEEKIVCESLRHEAAPEKPSWIQKLLHMINSNWCSKICGDYERYQKDTARLEDSLPRGYQAVMAAADAKKKQQTPAPSPAPTKEAFTKKLAAGLLSTCREKAKIGEYAQLLGKTQEDVEKDPQFTEFLEKPETQATMQKYLRGEKVHFSEVTTAFLNGIANKPFVSQPSKQVGMRERNSLQRDSVLSQKDLKLERKSELSFS